MDAKEKAQSWNRTVERRLFLRDTALTAAGLTGATLLGGVPAFSKERRFGRDDDKGIRTTGTRTRHNKFLRLR